MECPETELKQVWDLALRGDESAYESALNLISMRLRRFFRARLRAMPDEVEDVLQETMIAIHNKRGTFDPAYPLEAWIFAIARHKLVDLFRRSGRKISLHESLDDVDEEMLGVDDQEHVAKRDLLELLDKLPKAQRQAIEMSKLQGFSLQEVSNQTGHSVASLKVLVHRGLKKLSAIIRSES